MDCFAEGPCSFAVDHSDLSYALFHAGFKIVRKEAGDLVGSEGVEI